MNQTCIINSEGVCFDPDDITLLGVYSDELSLFRAKSGWTKVLESNFMLEDTHDFSIEIVKDYESLRFRLACRFNTACGRYAFWRITNYQAPEAQYEIETAHIPNSSSRQLDLISAPDLLPLYSTPLVVTGLSEQRSSSVLAKVLSQISKFRSRLLSGLRRKLDSKFS